MKNIYRLKLIIIFLFIFLITVSISAQTKIDSLKTQLQLKPENQKPGILVDLAEAFITIQSDSSIKYANIGILLSDKLKDNVSKPEFYRIIGKNHSDNRNNKLALFNYNYAAQLLEKSNNQDKLADIYNSIGIIYGKIYNYDKSLYYIHKSISILVKAGDNKRLSVSLNNLGVIYRGLKDFNKSLAIFQQSLYFARKSGNEIAIASSLNNISLTYFHKQKYNDALKFQLEAIKIFEKFKNKKRLCSSYISVGVIYQKLNYNKIANDYFYKSSKLASEVNDQYLLSFALQNIGAANIIMKNYTKAIEYLKQSEIIANKIQDLGCIKTINELMSDYYAQTGDFKKAYEHHKIFKSINDSIYNKESNERFQDLQVKYEVDEKDNENKILKQQTTIQQLAIQKQIYLRNTFIAVSCVVVLLVLFVLYNFILKRNANKKLSQKNELITLQKDKLEEANATKDKFFSLIAHDLKTPFYIILRYTQLLKTKFYELSDSEKKENIDELHDYTMDIYIILENLLTWSRSQRGMVHVKKEQLVLSNLIYNSIKPFKANAKNKSITINNFVDPSTIIYADNYTISTIIGNLFNNAIKFTPVGGNITFETNQVNPEEIEINIKDNGIGIKEEDLKKLFQTGGSFSTEGTEKEKGTGLGLIICKEFIEYNNGSISVNSKVDEGSVFTIKLPVEI